jgi:integrase
VRLPVVLSREEASLVLSRLRGPAWLMASLMYGAGLRLLECVELRVKDADFDRGELTIRDGKGGKDRRTMLAAALRDPLRALEAVTGYAATPAVWVRAIETCLSWSPRRVHAPPNADTRDSCGPIEPSRPHRATLQAPSEYSDTQFCRILVERITNNKTGAGGSPRRC